MRSRLESWIDLGQSIKPLALWERGWGEGAASNLSSHADLVCAFARFDLGAGGCPAPKLNPREAHHIYSELFCLYPETMQIYSR